MRLNCAVMYDSDVMSQADGVLAESDFVQCIYACLA